MPTFSRFKLGSGIQRRGAKLTAVLLTVAASAALGATTGVSHGATVYQDSFARTGDLNGSTPTVDTGTATWTTTKNGLTTATNGIFTTSLTPPEATVNNTASDSLASLPLTVVSGSIASTTVTLTPTGSTTSSNWLGLGFVFDNNAGDRKYFVLYRADGGTQYFNGGNANNGGTAPIAETPDTFTIAINDTNTANPTISFTDTLGLTDKTLSLTSAQVSSITGVALLNYEQTGNFTNFSASDAVPEPATLSLLGLGGLAMLRRRRKA